MPGQATACPGMCIRFTGRWGPWRERPSPCSGPCPADCGTGAGVEARAGPGGHLGCPAEVGWSPDHAENGQRPQGQDYAVVPAPGVAHLVVVQAHLLLGHLRGLPGLRLRACVPEQRQWPLRPLLRSAPGLASRTRVCPCCPARPLAYRWLGGKGRVRGKADILQPGRLVGPISGQVEFRIQLRISPCPGVGQEGPDLAVLHLSRRAAVLPRHPPRSGSPSSGTRFRRQSPPSGDPPGASAHSRTGRPGPARPVQQVLDVESQLP